MEFRFRLRIVDMDLPAVEGWAQTGLADLDGDGRLEYILGLRYGDIYWYKPISPSRWERRLLGRDSPSDVGGCVLDVDGDRFVDFVAGGVWYRNPGEPGRVFERIVFDPSLEAVHDMKTADIDGDGRVEVIAMSDRTGIRWYKIPEDPRRRWVRYDVGPAVHAGLAVGDIDGDGDLDVVRSDVWFENVEGDGSRWVEHPIGPTTPPPPDFQPPFAFNSTKCVVCDVDSDGVNDVVFTDAEIPGGKVWWMENVDGLGLRWRRHLISGGVTPRRGAYHSLYVGDLDGDGDLDVFSCEMEAVPGVKPPRWYIWENLDGRGGRWREHVVLDANLGGHEAVVGDLTGNGLLDIVGKPWSPSRDNALGGRMFVAFLENVSR